MSEATDCSVHDDCATACVNTSPRDARASSRGVALGILSWGPTASARNVSTSTTTTFGCSGDARVRETDVARTSRTRLHPAVPATDAPGVADATVSVRSTVRPCHSPRSSLASNQRRSRRSTAGFTS